ncbi:MAG: pyridoxamine 5'-phosphate oxidase family protein [Pseudonocardiaceae bacterium]|nr:MAG: pyridoxamine 5'-phosphate oxidase family protein [Pseudonocardiaceae bacterium]
MSIAVTTDELGRTLADFRFAYLLTIGDDARPHVTAVSPVWDGRHLRVGDLGRRTRANAGARPEVTLVWPPADPAGHSLIVDGTGVVDGSAAEDGVLAVTVTRAVLHRAAAAPAPVVVDGACAADCVEIQPG